MSVIAKSLQSHCKVIATHLSVTCGAISYPAAVAKHSGIFTPDITELLTMCSDWIPVKTTCNSDGGEFPATASSYSLITQGT